MNEEEIEDEFPCSSLAVDSIIRVGTAGLIWGLCIGPYDAHKRGLTGIARASFVVNVSIAGAVAGAAIATRTRSWKQVFGMAAFMSAFCTAADYSKTI
ncbi:hypothetical protein HHK36_022928 [Tetracentron sinense]|uniref:Uncharacterized protein n=1 Tax=Tetracentron sinense TaxID=13715 RepID=A0A835D6I5_TETSI|nr:hypothetical protein HHK36_022928 [Tetracentron sinense]